MLMLVVNISYAYGICQEIVGAEGIAIGEGKWSLPTPHSYSIKFQA
jgi:hypothetical protein